MTHMPTLTGHNSMAGTACPACGMTLVRPRAQCRMCLICGTSLTSGMNGMAMGASLPPWKGSRAQMQLHRVLGVALPPSLKVSISLSFFFPRGLCLTTVICAMNRIG
jgi:hypothetical protein